MPPSISPVRQYMDMSTDVIVADFNGDTKDDIFVANFHDASIFTVMSLNDSSAFCKLFLNNSLSPGTFTWNLSSFPLIKYPATSADAADFDGDGDIDLVIGMEKRGDTLFGQEYSYTMTSKIFINDGNGNFTDSTQWKFPAFKKEYTSCFDIHFVDMNGDGFLDVFGAGIHNFLFMQNPLTKTFADSTHLLPTFPAHPNKKIPHTFHSYGAGFGDFDNNGETDIFLTDTYEQPRLQFQLSNGKLIDTTTTNLPPDGENSEYCVIADFNGDNLPDIAKVNNGNINTHALYIRSGSLNGYPYFTDKSMQIPLDTTFIRNYGIDYNDIDGDTDNDLLIAGESGIKLFENDGSGNFTENTSWLNGITGLNYSTRVKFADINSDGYKDIFVPRAQNLTSGQSNKILIWDTTSSKYDDQSASLLPPNSKASIDIDFVDINSDNWLDFVVANDNGSELYLSSGGGVYGITNPFTLSNSRSIKFGLLDSDTLWDVIEVNKVNNTDAKIYSNNGTSTPYGLSVSIPQSNGESYDIGIFDFNNDGLNDILIADFEKENKIFINQGGVFSDSTIVYFPYYPDTLLDYTSGSFTKAIKIADVNQDGLVDVYLVRDNQDLLFYGQGLTTGIYENSLANLKRAIVYPNPVNHSMTIVFPEHSLNTKISVFNSMGSLIYEALPNLNQTNIDMSKYVTGIYFLKITYSDNQIEIHKIIVQH